MQHSRSAKQLGLSQESILHGESQAKWLAQMLGDEPVRIFTSPELRAIATANELKQVLGSRVQVTVDRQLAPGNMIVTRKIARTARANRNFTIVLVTHEPIIQLLYAMASAPYVPTIFDASFHFFHWHLVSLTLHADRTHPTRSTTPDER